MASANSMKGISFGESGLKILSNIEAIFEKTIFATFPRIFVSHRYPIIKNIYLFLYIFFWRARVCWPLFCLRYVAHFVLVRDV
jgi:hypothetical protein